MEFPAVEKRYGKESTTTAEVSIKIFADWEEREGGLTAFGIDGWQEVYFFELAMMVAPCLGPVHDTCRCRSCEELSCCFARR